MCVFGPDVASDEIECTSWMSGKTMLSQLSFTEWLIPVAGVECDACAFDEWVLQLVVGG